MDTSPPPPAPPYGSLIEVARKGARLTMQRAAGLAGVSKATWIDSTRGYRKRGAAWEPVDPKPETVARMAHAVTLNPDRLESEGKHPQAAEILREILRTEPEAVPAAALHPAAPPPGPALPLDLADDEETIARYIVNEAPAPWRVKREMLQQLFTLNDRERQAEAG